MNTAESVFHENGMNLHIVPSKKYKTITIIAKLKAPLAKDTITKRALLPYVLQQGTQSYPNRRAIQLKLDSLYGAVLSLDGTKKGNNHIISIRLEIANQKFISDEAEILDEAIALFKEVIFNPNTTDDSFIQTTVEREKETLRQKISSVVDNKMNYANTRLIDEMCGDELYHLHVQGYEEDMDAITAENLFTYYQAALHEDQLDIYVLGDFETETMKKRLTTTFQRDGGETAVFTISDVNKQPEKPNVVIENQNVQQAKLHFGYRTNITYQDNDYYALQVFNGLFGGFPSSKLFINVREKNSLAYYAASRVESHKGLLLVFSGIAPNDYEKAKEIIELQMDAMKNGEFTEEEMTNTKELITNQLRETMDNPQGMIELLYQQVVGNTNRSPEELINGINEVGKSNVVDAANKIVQDTVYLLTKKGGESDE